MPIPDFQSVRAVLEFCSDGQEHSSRDAIEYLAKYFDRSELELKERLPSGRQSTFQNRISWARSHGKSGDEGIDGIIKEDRFGLDIIYIQAKRWEGKISRPEVQKFAGALQGKRARKGVFITTSDFSEGAKEYVSNIDSKIILISGEQLAQLMIDFNVGVTVEAKYEIQRLDSDYFSED